MTNRDNETGCWIWTGAKNATGYGRMAVPTGKMGGRRDFSHRVAYEHYVGPIPEGLVIDHLCRQPACCNPEHLEAVTQAENLRRGKGTWAAQAAKTHCKYGHEFTEENTRLVPGGRRCKQCELRRARESKARKPANLLLAYSEWLDSEGLVKPDHEVPSDNGGSYVVDDRPHDQLVAEFLEQHKAGA